MTPEWRESQPFYTAGFFSVERWGFSRARRQAKVIRLARRKAQSGARKGGRRRTPEAHQQTPKQVPWTVITVSVLLLLVLVGIGILFWSWFDAKPVQTTYQTALETLLAKNVSPIIAPDIATDFAGGNLTLRQLSKKYPGFEQDIRAADETIRNAEKDVLAIVNGETITRADLNRQSALLPESYRTALSDPQILDEMINEKLLLQDAAAKGIIASETEIQQGLDDLLTKGKLIWPHNTGLAHDAQSPNNHQQALQRNRG